MITLKQEEQVIVVIKNGEKHLRMWDFITDNSEGVLTNDGKLVWNEKHRERRLVVYGDEVCRECRILPLCHGHCSQMKIEHQGKAGTCRFG